MTLSLAWTASSSSRFSRRPETRWQSRKARMPADPAGGANGGGGEDLVSIGSPAAATATAVRWGKVFRVADRRHPDGCSHRRRTCPLRRVNQPRPVQVP